MVRTDVHHRLRKASVGLAVLGLHLVGLLAWWTLERHTQPARDDRRTEPIAVWLPMLPAPDLNKPPPTRAQQRMQASATPSQPTPHSTQQPSADATAVAAPNGVPTPVPANGAPEVQATSQAAPALNLSLSRQAITSLAPPSFADQSPFHGRLPATVERQIATAAAESGPWTEERIDNDHVRFRRGNTCILLQRPRAAAIDPFNEALARIPWRTSGLEECR